jgi:hypothetical protein
MFRTAHSVLALVVLALTDASPPKTDPAVLEGFYAASQTEMVSALKLMPDGRFVWFLSYGALDLIGEGRWSRHSDGSLLLNSEPTYVAPRFERIDAEGGGQAGLLVTVVDQHGDTPTYLEALIEFDDGVRRQAHLQGGAHRFPAEPGRTIVALYLGSIAFDFISGPYPVTAEDNVMHFHFFPNHIGRADFRHLLVDVEADVLTFTWRGRVLRYLRQNDGS